MHVSKCECVCEWNILGLRNVVSGDEDCTHYPHAQSPLITHRGFETVGKDDAGDKCIENRADSSETGFPLCSLRATLRNSSGQRAMVCLRKHSLAFDQNGNPETCRVSLSVDETWHCEGRGSRMCSR